MANYGLFEVPTNTFPVGAKALHRAVITAVVIVPRPEHFGRGIQSP
jgi:hypothetical protein